MKLSYVSIKLIYILVSACTDLKGIGSEHFQRFFFTNNQTLRTLQTNRQKQQQNILNQRRVQYNYDNSAYTITIMIISL